MSPAPQTVADALAWALDRWGVRAVFGVSGANIEDFHDALLRQGGSIRAVAARSENGAAFMADAHARTHRTLGVCCATSGGGMMNLAVGIAEACQDGVPVLAIVGQVPRDHEGRGGFQDSSGRGAGVDARGLWTAISKTVVALRSGAEVWTALRSTVEVALAGRPGPGVLLIPKDVFSEPCPPIPADWPQHLPCPPEALPQPEQLGPLVEALRSARRPVLVAGPGVRRHGATQALVRAARHLSIPVMSTVADVGAYPQSDPLYLGTIGAAGHPSAHRYLAEDADLVVVVGGCLERMQRGPLGQERAGRPVWVLGVDPTPATRVLSSVQVLAARPGALLSALSAQPTLAGIGGGRPRGYQLHRYLPLLAPRPTGSTAAPHAGLRTSTAVQRLHRALPSRGHLLFDAGNCSASALHWLEVPDGLSTQIALGMGGMGYALAGAIGAQLGAAEGERVVALVGDGAFLMLGMEVHTAIELGLPVLFVVFNDGGHGMCVTRQQVFLGGRITCARYPAARVVDVAQGLAGDHALWTGRATTPTELDAQLDALDQWSWRGPAVLELVLQRPETPPFTPFLPADAPTGVLPAAPFNPSRTAHVA